MTTPSIKNVSAADIEAAIGRALAELTGWEICKVSIQTADYSLPGLVSGETVTLTLQASLGPKKVLGFPL